jgi:hypothetical protein
MFLFFSVARSAQTSQAERANQANSGNEVQSPAGTELVSTAEKLPSDFLIDVSPLALRMSSPFNAGYWLAAA